MGVLFGGPGFLLKGIKDLDRHGTADKLGLKFKSLKIKVE